MAVNSSLRNLCVPLRLCGEIGNGQINRRGAEERRGYAEETQRRVEKGGRATGPSPPALPFKPRLAPTRGLP